MSNLKTLITNPGSASRKYALYTGDKKLTSIHFEMEENAVVYSVDGGDVQPADISHFTFASSKLSQLLVESGHILNSKDIDAVGIRIVAPSPYFQKSRILDSTARERLNSLLHAAPIHIDATMQELQLLERFLPHKKVIGISDSSFHSSMPDYASTYAIPQDTAKKLGLQRYGYHGLSVQSVVRVLKEYHSVPERLVVCHLGGGSSVTALRDGKSIDTTMGFSPVEGLTMSTRSGNIDPTAVQLIAASLELTPIEMQQYLNHKSGLLGVSGSSADIRELLKYEKTGNDSAKLALSMYTYHVQQAIGQMAAALGGVDALVFTGTVGERSSIIRKRVCRRLEFLGIEIDSLRNNDSKLSKGINKIKHTGSPVDIYVVNTDEMGEIALQTWQLLES